MRHFFDRLFGREPTLCDASLHDAQALATLHADSFHRGWNAQEFEQLLLDRNVLTQCALIGNKLVGFIMSRFAVDEAEILSVAVARRQRGRGLSRRLLTLHLGRLAGLGVRKVFLEVDPDNAPALRLYRRAGFQEVGKRDTYYVKPAAIPTAALVLRRDLT